MTYTDTFKRKLMKFTHENYVYVICMLSRIQNTHMHKRMPSMCHIEIEQKWKGKTRGE